MSMITARTRALALSFLISVSLTACFGSGDKPDLRHDPARGEPRSGADHTADDSADQ